jgi:signal-transduction protein with cAMP-binding, CBS, and nucleotidyltransferase domain
MKLKLEDVKRMSVVAIGGSYTAKQAAKIMDYRGISSLVVTLKKFAGIKREKYLCSRVVAKEEVPKKVKVISAESLVRIS